MTEKPFKLETVITQVYNTGRNLFIHDYNKTDLIYFFFNRKLNCLAYEHIVV